MKLATIERVLAVYPHPNADLLEIVQVLGYRCIVRKGAFHEGDLVVLIQPDTVLPKDAEWAASYQKTSRVKAIRLRGEWSFGIVESLAILPKEIQAAIIFNADGSIIGADVSEILGITKYESSPKDQSWRNLQEDARGRLPYNIPKTDEERWQNVDLSPLMGQTVDVGLKIDGQSFTAYCALGKNQENGDIDFGVCSRSLNIKLDRKNLYTDHISRYDLESRLREYCTKHNVSLAVRGESYGAGIQNHKHNAHATMQPALALFSVWLIDEMRYADSDDEHNLFTLSEALGVPTVPMLERNVPLTKDLITKYDSDLERLDNGAMFEGVVIKGKGWSFKVINKHYDAKK